VRAEKIRPGAIPKMVSWAKQNPVETLSIKLTNHILVFKEWRNFILKIGAALL
jgi:hypothetical protein